EESEEARTAADDQFEQNGDREPKAGPAIAATDPWTSLLQTGVALFQQLATASRGGTASAAPGLSLVRRDDRTGETYLRLPVPSQEVLDQALQAFGALLEGLRK